MPITAARPSALEARVGCLFICLPCRGDFAQNYLLWNLEPNLVQLSQGWGFLKWHLSKMLPGSHPTSTHLLVQDPAVDGSVWLRLTVSDGPRHQFSSCNPAWPGEHAGFFLPCPPTFTPLEELKLGLESPRWAGTIRWWSRYQKVFLSPVQRGQPRPC